MTAGVYIITNKLNGHQYVGSSANIQNRWQHHTNRLNKNNHHSTHLQNAWNKYGSNAFEFGILEVCSGIKETLLEREQFYLDSVKPVYNISPTAGSSLGIKHSLQARANMSEAHKNPSVDIRAKLSAAHKGHKPSTETRAKRSAALKGRVISAETRAKISITLKGHDCSAETRAKISAACKNPSAEARAKITAASKNPSAETKAKLSAAHKGHICSAETRAKLSEANRGKKLSEEHKAKISAAVKAYWQRKKQEARNE
jgi:group I intron endonuclease